MNGNGKTTVIDNETQEIVPVESTETETASLISRGSDESYIIALEQAAKNAPRLENAMQTLLVAVTQPEDWNYQGGKACLSSAGAERFIKHFHFVFTNWKCAKEVFNDGNGSGYRYVYTCDAFWEGRQVRAEGRYSTRENFLGKTDKAWNAVEDINENSIQTAAYHRCQGNAIKTMLGLRGYSENRIKGILGMQGKDTAEGKTVQHNQGAQGGVSDDDRSRQVDIGKWLGQMYHNDESAMKDALVSVTSFKGKDGTQVKGVDSIKLLKGKRLEIAHKNIKQCFDDWAKSMDDNNGGNDGEIPFGNEEGR